LKREQAEVARELDKLTRDNPALQKALDEARAEQARQAAEEAKALAEKQRELAKASAETEKQRAQERFAALAEKQRELAKRAEKLGQETEPQARLATKEPFAADSAKKAAEALKEGDTQKALEQQDRAAVALDKLGRDLDRALDLSRD